MVQQLTSQLQSLANPQKAKDLSWFFKTGPGQYGEGDKFLGIVVPLQRNLVKLYWDTVTLNYIQQLLDSPYHEYRLTGLLILVKQYPNNKKNVFDFYLKNTKNINNWDLVDLSSRDIVGAYCFEQKNYSILTKLSRSKDLWEKRTSIVSTAFYIKNLDFIPTLEISKTLLSDPHDLIHKAVGWMLREVGKRNQKPLIDFLDQHHSQMPRTALRYAIERLPESLRLYYLHLKP